MDEGCKEEGEGMVEKRGGKERWMRDVRKRKGKVEERGREGKVDEGYKEEEDKCGRVRRKERWMRDVRKRGKEWWKEREGKKGG